MSQAARSPWSLEHFLEWERAQTRRHEYAGDVIVAMTGGTLRHNATVNRIAAQLERVLANTPCRVFRENVKLVTATSCRYPDVLVSCAAVDLDTDCIEDAELLVEVLSQSTESIDRTEKPAEYRSLSSLRAYVIVDRNGDLLEGYVRESLESPWIRTAERILVGLHGAHVEFA